MKRPFLTLLLTVFAAAALCAQDEPPAPQAPAAGRRRRRTRRFSAAAPHRMPTRSPMTGVITKGRQDHQGPLYGSPAQGALLLRDSQERSRQGVPMEHPDREKLPSVRATAVDNWTTKSSGGTSRATACCSPKSPTA